MTSSITLYHTDGCHLCDEAIVLLEQLNLSYQRVDIIDDQSLVELYAIRIPVVENKQKATLNWPFSLQQLQVFTSNP